MPNNIIIKPDSKGDKRNSVPERGGAVGRFSNNPAESAESQSHKVSTAVKSNFKDLDSNRWSAIFKLKL